MGIWKKNHHKISEIQSVKEILGGGNLQDFFSDFYIFLSLSRTSNQPQISQSLTFRRIFLFVDFRVAVLSHPHKLVRNPTSRFHKRPRFYVEPPSQLQTWGLKVHHNMGSVEEFFCESKKCNFKTCQGEERKDEKIEKTAEEEPRFFFCTQIF